MLDRENAERLLEMAYKVDALASMIRDYMGTIIPNLQEAVEKAEKKSDA